MAEREEAEAISGSDRDRRGGFGFIAAAVVGAVFLVFILQNTRSVGIQWLFFESRTPLWLALLMSVVVGVILGELGGFALRRRRRRGDQRASR